MRRIIDNSNQKEKRKGLLQNSLFGKAAYCYVVLGRHSCNRICIIYVINKNKKEERINTAYGRLASKPG